MHPESSPASRSVPHGQEPPRRLPRHSDERDSSFQPFDKRRRNFVSHDHDAQDPIVAQQCRDAEPRRSNSWISRPRLGNCGGRSASHRGYQLEQGVTLNCTTLSLLWIPPAIAKVSIRGPGTQRIDGSSSPPPERFCSRYCSISRSRRASRAAVSGSGEVTGPVYGSGLRRVVRYCTAPTDCRCQNPQR